MPNRKANPPIDNEIKDSLTKNSDYLFNTRKIPQSTIDLFEAGGFLDSEHIIHRRAMIPMHNIDGELIGFFGRSIYPRNKDTGGFYPADYDPGDVGPLYGKWRMYPHEYNRHRDLYNLNRAKGYIKQTGVCVAVEGVFDAWRLWDEGVKNVVSVFGIALTSHHMELLASVGCKKIKLMLDGDRPGFLSAKKIIRMYKDHPIEIKFIPVPDGVDPNDMTRKDLYSLRKLSRAARRLNEKYR